MELEVLPAEALRISSQREAGTEDPATDDGSSDSGDLGGKACKGGGLDSSCTKSGAKSGVGAS